MENNVELIDVVLALEDWSSSKELGEHTSHAPDVDYGVQVSVEATERGRTLERTGCSVVGKGQHDLGRSIPPRGDVSASERCSQHNGGSTERQTSLLSHESCSSSRCEIGVRLEASCQSKIADLELAIRVDL